MTILNQNIAYFMPARKAARLENRGHYDKAAALWDKACKFAKNPLNKEWCKRRGEFCLHRNY